MGRSEFLNLTSHHSLVSTFKIFCVYSLYEYIGVPEVCFLLNRAFLFSISLLIFVGIRTSLKGVGEGAQGEGGGVWQHHLSSVACRLMAGQSSPPDKP